MKYYEIDEALAAESKACWSTSDYVTGSSTAEYRQKVDEAYTRVDNALPENKEKAKMIADLYAKKLAEWYNKSFRVEMMCPSVLIAGFSNFPVRKKEQQNRARKRLYEEYDQISAILQKIEDLAHASNVIKSGQADAVELLERKIAKLESDREYMKSANAYYRKNKTMKGFNGMDDNRAQSLDEKIAGACSWEQQPYPGWQLTNIGATIRTAKKRMESLKAKKQEGDVITARSDVPFVVKENKDIMRLQLIFNDKPNASVRAILKSNGFRWAPSESAWQRILTPNALSVYKSIETKLIEAMKEE